MKIVCISGKAQNGKDSTANILKRKLEERGQRVLVTHFGDLLKYICSYFFGWDGKKDQYGRSLLQRIGTDVIRKKEPDYWVNFLSHLLSFFVDEWDWVLVPDCRFSNEYNVFKQSGFDTIHMRILRPGFKSPLTPEQQMHPSETALDNSTPDFYIENSGTLEDLEITIERWIKENVDERF